MPLFRTLLPSDAVAYAQGHDEGVQRAMALEGIPGDAQWLRTLLPCLCEWEARDQIGITLAPSGFFWHLEQTRCPCCKIDSPRFETKSQTFLMEHRRLAAWERNVLHLQQKSQQSLRSNRWERGGVVWASFSWPHRCSIATVSSAIQGGLFCRGEHVLPINTGPSLESGRMVGSTSRLPLPNTIFGRLLYLPNRAPHTRLICVHTPEQGPSTSCADVPQHLKSGLHPWCFGGVQMRVGLRWTSADVIEEHAPGREG